MILDMGLPINNLLSWKNLMLMTLGFSFIAAPLGVPPLLGILVAALIFGLSHIDEKVRDPNNKKERQEAFISSLVFGLVASYGFLALMLITMSPSEYSELFKFGGIIFPICLMFFVNYGVSLGWWPSPSIFYVSMLVSMVPALLLHTKIGMVGPNVIISSLVASIVYAILIGETKGKPEPWMKWQAIYIGILAGSASAVGLNFLVKKLESPFDELLMVVDGYVGFSWFLVFLMWILVQAKAPMPHKWDTIFQIK
jgi:hypothetical protein